MSNYVSELINKEVVDEMTVDLNELKVASQPFPTNDEEEHEQQHTLLGAREFINREDRKRKSNLAQFQENKRITLSQRVAQARIEQVKDLEMKAQNSEYGQFLVVEA